MKCEVEKNNPAPWQQVQGVYVHIPFCVQKCLYCDFTSYACYDEAFMQSYADAVCREISHKSRQKINICRNATIYFGGGTPSVLPAECIERIVNCLKAHGFWQQPQEATIEVNPGTADLCKLQRLKAMGFDRISFGVQSLNNEELKMIGRIHSAEEAAEAVKMAKQAGFVRINADLIYGLPGQTVESLQKTLQQMIAMDIEHLSVYGLILEEGTPLARLVEEGKINLPDDDTCADMYELVQEILSEHHYERYEISNYAKRGAYSRHNLVYWHYYPYVAFGAAACGFDGTKRLTGTNDVKSYVHNVPADDLIYNEEKLTKEEMFSEFMFMNLRKSEGVDLSEAEERFGIDVYQVYAEALKPFLEKKMLEYDKGNNILRLTASGMELGNQIFEIFVIV